MTATTRLGVRVLELPGLKGISLDNYECKLEQRSKKKCNKNNQMEASKLNRTLKVRLNFFDSKWEKILLKEKKLPEMRFIIFMLRIMQNVFF